MTDTSKVPAYDISTGRKRLVPPHWLKVFPDRFRKTPLSTKQEKQLGQVDADKVTQDAEADAQRRLAANRTGILPQIPGAVGEGTTTPTDSTNGDTNPPANGATTEGA